MNRLLKDIKLVGLSKVFIILFGIGTTSIVSKYLGPEKTGILVALMVYPNIFMSFGSLGIRQAVTFFTGKEIYSEKQIKSAILSIWLFSSVLSILICFVLIRYFSNSGGNLLWVLLAISPIPFKLLITYINGFFLGKNEIKIFSNISWLPYLITFLGAVVLIIALNYGITGAILAYIAGPFILFLVCYFKFLSKIQFVINFELKVIKALLSLGLVYAFALIINVLNYSFDAILLDKLSTSYELGIYARGAGLAQYLWQIPLILGTIVFARSSISKDGRKYSLKALQLMRLSFVVVMALCAILYFASPLVIHLLYGPEFSGSVNILRILLPGVLLLTTFKVLNMDLAGKGKPLIAVKAMLPALLINIVLNILWIPKYGGTGAAVASMISYTFATLLFVFFYSIETKISLKQIIFYKKSDFAPIVDFVAKIF